MKMNLKIMLKSLLDLRLSELVTDKTTLIYDAENLEVGTEVFVKDEENEDKVKPAEDGEYVDEEGRTIVVVEGKVTEIREAEKAEEEPVKEEEEVQVEAEVIIDTPDADPIEEVVIEEDEIDLKELLRKQEEMLKGLSELYNAMAGLEGRIGELEEKLNKLEQEPAAEPVDETVVEEEVKASRMSYLKK